MKRWKGYEYSLVLVHFILALEARGRIHRDHSHVSSRSIVSVYQRFGYACGSGGVTAAIKVAYTGVEAMDLHDE